MEVINYGAELAPSMQNFGNALRYRNERNEAEAARQQQQETLKQAAQLYSTGTPDEIAQFSIENPQVAKLLSEQIGYRDDATKQNEIETMQGILTNPDRAEELLQNRVNYLKSVGADPSHTLGEIEFLRSNPEGYTDIVEKGYAFKDPVGHKAYRSTLPQDKPGMSDFQKAQIGLQRDRLNLDRDRLNASRNQGESTMDELKREMLEQKVSQARSDKKTKSIEDKSSMDSNYSSFVDALNLVDAIENHEGFSSAVGFESAFPTVSGSNAAGAESLIETLNSQNFLNSVQSMKGLGALSEGEGKKVASAVASLNKNMSEKDFKRTLNVIRGITKRAKSKLETIYSSKGIDVPEVDNVYSNKKKAQKSDSTKTLKWNELKS